MILSGKEVQAHLKDNIAQEILAIKDDIYFAIIYIGDNFASQKYINHKVKFSKELGITCQVVHLEESVEQHEVEKIITILNEDSRVHGIMIQLPLPEHLDAFYLTQKINKDKDIDGFNVQNIGLSYLNKFPLMSCTPKGIMTMLDYYEIPLEGKAVTIAGRSNLVGKMLALLLINRGATVTVCNSQTKNIETFINNSDIFISAIGKPKYFTDKHINNKNLTVIDVGTNFLEGKLVGDVDFTSVSPLVKNISPVPGGVGPLTVTELFRNIIQAYKKQRGLE